MFYDAVPVSMRMEYNHRIKMVRLMIRNDNLKTLVIALALMSLLAAPAFAAAPQVESLQWPSDSISLSNLQSQFSQHPGLSDLHIDFPNHSSWDVSDAALKQFNRFYAEHAAAFGFAANMMPDISFSSLMPAGASGGALHLPAMGGVDAMQANLGTALRAAQLQDLNLSSLPDWLQNLVLQVYQAILTICASFRDGWQSLAATGHV